MKKRDIRDGVGEKEEENSGRIRSNYIIHTYEVITKPIIL